MRVRMPLLLAFVLLTLGIVGFGATRVMAEARAAMADEVQQTERIAALERARALGENIEAARRRVAVTADYQVVQLAVSARSTALLTTALQQAGGAPGVVGGAVTDSAGQLTARAGADVDLTHSRKLVFWPGRADRSGHVGISAPIGDGTGGVLGWLHQEFDLAGLAPRFLDRIRYLDGTTSLLTRQGDLLLRPSEAAPWLRSTALRELLGDGRTASTTHYSKALGTHRVTAVSPVPGTMLMAVVGADLDAANRPAVDLLLKLGRILAIMLVVIGVLASLAAALVARSSRRLVAGRLEAEAMANTDALTSVGSRRSFDVAVRQIASRPGDTAVVVVDLDHLKTLNDNHGHDVGDDALRKLGAALLRSVRPGDVVSRLGGDEFAVLLPATTMARAREVAHRVEREVAEIDIPGFGPLAACTGVAVGPNRSIDRVVIEADGRLYEAKHTR